MVEARRCPHPLLQRTDRAKAAIDPAHGGVKLLLTLVPSGLILADRFGLIFIAQGGDSSLSQIAGFDRLGKAGAPSRSAETSVTFALRWSATPPRGSSDR